MKRRSSARVVLVAGGVGVLLVLCLLCTQYTPHGVGGEDIIILESREETRNVKKILLKGDSTTL